MDFPPNIIFDCVFDNCNLTRVDFGGSHLKNVKFIGRLDDVWFRGLKPTSSYEIEGMDNIDRSKKINPMIGAAGVSAFPMSARVVQKIAHDEDPSNFILMQAVSANVSGQLGSAIAGGCIIALAQLFI